MYNPMRMYQVGYNLTTLKIAHCLNECSGHGQCDDTGTCKCDANWAGGDCSVNKAGECQVGAPHHLCLHAHLHTLMSVKCTHTDAAVQCADCVSFARSQDQPWRGSVGQSQHSKISCFPLNVEATVHPNCLWHRVFVAHKPTLSALLHTTVVVSAPQHTHMPCLGGVCL